MNIEIEVKKLEKNRLLKTDEEIKNFEEAIDNIVEINDINSVEYLCRGFDDYTEYPEIMYGLLHTIEDYEGIDALIQIAKITTIILPRAKSWVKRIHYGILNSNKDRILYIEALKSVDKLTRENIIQLLVEIKLEDSKLFEVKINEILKEI